MRPDGVVADRCGDDEGFGVVDDEGRKRRGWTFYDSFGAFDQIEDIDAVAGMMWHGPGEPVPSSLDELEFVRPVNSSRQPGPEARSVMRLTRF